MLFSGGTIGGFRTFVAPLSSSTLPGQLLALLDGRSATFLDVLCQIRQVHPTLGLLTAFDAHDGQGNVAAKCHPACNFDPLSGGSASKIDPLQVGLMRCSL